jgi:hypothetical protein
VVTVKSRLIPLTLRPSPPLLSSSPLLSAYNHANNPITFDMKASARESLEAYNRCHPGVDPEADKARMKVEKAAWNEVVNWVMNERRVEKLLAIDEERTRRLREVTKTDEIGEDEGVADLAKKRRTSGTVVLPGSPSPSVEEKGGIFRVPWLSGRGDSPFDRRRTGSPSPLSGFKQGITQRPMSPRRLDKKRGVTGIYTGMGEYSPRGRTYTPPRILPSGDETAPNANGSPVPTLPKFDFVSPLGLVSMGRLATPRKGSLEPVKEEEETGEWTLVTRGKRAGSAPCRDKAGMGNGKMAVEIEGMRVD